MNKLEKIIVEGQTTFELIGEQMIFDRDEMFKMMEIPQLNIERDAYHSISKKVRIKMMAEPISSGRRYVIHHDGCETAFHFLMKREVPTLLVYMRSSSFIKLSSDLSFLSELALQWKCKRLIVTFGSLHYIVGEKSYE